MKFYFVFGGSNQSQNKRWSRLREVALRHTRELKQHTPCIHISDKSNTLKEVPY